MPRKIILPTDVSNRLENLTNLEEEVAGILFYRQIDEYCPIESMFITGIGSENSVQDKKERIEVANRFFRENQGYRFVKFHTHSKGTITKFGQYFANNFSSEDLVEIKKNMDLDKYFIAMLVTPQVKILKGYDSPELFIGNYPEYADLNRETLQKLDDIANSLGYDLNTLSARLK
ncbi:MAG: hypothetical protein PHU51_03180 [Candidatus Nanoarchaeia archaeon]|nr:hypothetical protein [Candidatus Nanoarchaeia archaeon]